jgi:glyoxylate reductase
VGRVLITHPLPPGSLQALDGHQVVQLTGEDGLDAPTLAAHMADARPDALICLLTDRVDDRCLAANPQLAVVATVSVGYDHVDVRAAQRQGTVVCHTPGVLDEATADLTWALILGAARLVGDAATDLRAGRWPGWGLLQYLGQDVHGATLGIIGFGRIGRAVARRATGFSMTVLHHARRPTGLPGYEPDLRTLLAASDIVSVHVPLTADTHHLIGAEELAVLRPSAVLVNTSRGPVIDEGALAEALHAGRLFAAGLDVYEDEPHLHPRLRDAPRTLCLPHIGSATVRTRTEMAAMAAADVAAVLAGRPPAHPVAGTWTSPGAAGPMLSPGTAGPSTPPEPAAPAMRPATDDPRAGVLCALGTATVGESGGQPVGPGIQPLDRTMTVAGPAVTVRCAAGDNLAVHVAVARAAPGTVLVVVSDGDPARGYLGEVLARAALARGVAGVVADVGVRDTREIIALGLPVFCSLVALPGAHKHGPGAVHEPLELRGTPVHDGDWVVADADGVVVVPADRLDAVVAAAQRRADHERHLFDALAAGRTTVELLGLDDASIADAGTSATDTGRLHPGPGR